jgi:hemin uptake protein HemP
MPIVDVPPLPPSPARLMAAPRPAAAVHAPTVDSRLLLNGAREIEIVHGDKVYRLRHTRNDKLILVK